MSGALKVSNLQLALNFNSFTLHAARGSLTIVLGPTGSGKGRLMQTLAGIVPAASGEILVHDKDPYAGDEKQWLIERKKIAYVLPSRTLISHLTVLQNVMLPLSYHGLANPQQAQQQAIEMLNQLAIEGNLAQLPSAYAEPERRLIALARALVLNPEILFVDQAFAHLDAALREQFTRTYANLMTREEFSLVLATKEFLAAKALSEAVSAPQQILFIAEQEILSFTSWSEFEQSKHPQLTTFIELHQAGHQASIAKRY